MAVNASNGCKPLLLSTTDELQTDRCVASRTVTPVTAPSVDHSPGFEYILAYDELLEQIAATNVVDADWPILRDMLKHKLAENINMYLSHGPPWPLSPEDAFKARGGAYDALDHFTGPPFTIQRICELCLHPQKHYTSLPKYLRSLMRVMSVASTRSSFLEDDSLSPPHASTSSTTLDGIPIVISTNIPDNSTPLTGPIGPTRRPSVPISPSSSPRALPVVVPLLSPIPWLIKTHSDDEDGSSIEDIDLNNPFNEKRSSSPSTTMRTLLSSPEGNRSPLRNNTFNHHHHRSNSPNTRSNNNNNNNNINESGVPQSNTQTPTGGVVDEVDPGSGGSEIVDPVALSSVTRTDQDLTGEGGQGIAKEGDGFLSVKGSSESLRERFVRASSPRVEKEDEAKEKDGKMQGGDKL